jgi:4-hydroxybenzoyl-CoA thioesterase
MGFPTVKLEMEFLSPVRYGVRVDIDMTVERVGRTSMVLRYDASVDGRPVFTARNTAVAVDLATLRPVPHPEWLRRRFEAGQDSTG